MSTLQHTAAATLAMIRDESVTVEQIARYFRQSETWAAGLVHAVCGDEDFAFAAQMDDYHPTQAEMDEYQAGYRHGVEMQEGDR